MFVEKYFGIITDSPTNFGEALALTQTQHVTGDTMLQLLHLWEYICWYQNAQIPITGNENVSTRIGISPRTGILFGSITRTVLP
jgi:hypothetical protein